MIDPRTLSFVWPLMLWLLLIVPLAAMLYGLLVRRRARQRARFPGMVPASTRAPGLRGLMGRHGAILLMLLGLSALLLAVARPRAMLLMPTAVETVMLAIDTSGSMRAADVKPSRIEAAQAAARAFVEDMPGRMRAGIVTISGTAAVAQAPTTERDDLYRAIEGVQLQRGSAIGSGILISLAELLPGAGIDAQKIINGASDEARREPQGAALGARSGGSAGPAKGAPDKAGPAASTDRGPATAAAEPGSNRSHAIILLTDGQGNTGPDALKMAELAAQHGVRIFTVGVGTPEGVTLNAQGMAMRVRLDEEALKKIADITQGEYFRATSAPDLKKIYRELSSRLTLERRQMTEVTAVFALFGALLAVLAALASMMRTGRIA